MPVTRSGVTAPAASPLYAYSKNFVASSGRYLAATASPTTGQLASWRYRMPAASTLKGTGMHHVLGRDH